MTYKDLIDFLRSIEASLTAREMVEHYRASWNEPIDPKDPWLKDYLNERVLHICTCPYEELPLLINEGHLTKLVAYRLKTEAP